MWDTKKVIAIGRVRPSWYLNLSYPLQLLNASQIETRTIMPGTATITTTATATTRPPKQMWYRFCALLAVQGILNSGIGRRAQSIWWDESALATPCPPGAGLYVSRFPSTYSKMIFWTTFEATITVVCICCPIWRRLWLVTRYILLGRTALC